MLPAMKDPVELITIDLHLKRISRLSSKTKVPSIIKSPRVGGARSTISIVPSRTYKLSPDLKPDSPGQYVPVDHFSAYLNGSLVRIAYRVLDFREK